MKTKTTKQFKRPLLLLVILVFNYLSIYCQYNVSGPETWNSGTNLATKTDWQNGIIINDGDILTIDGIALNFNSTASITVEPGGHLFITGSTLTSTNTTSAKWEGIAAEGYTTEPHFNTEPDPLVENDPSAWEGVLNGDQTIVSITNSTISNAKYGVVSNYGAIIRARNTNFTNNETGASLNYISFLVNASYFMDCIFNWNNDYLNLPFNQSSLTHLKFLM